MSRVCITASKGLLAAKYFSGYSCVQPGLETGNAASPTTSNQSTDSGTDELGVTSGYSYPAPTLNHFSPRSQGVAPLTQVFELQTRIPTASLQLSPTGIPNSSCTKSAGPRCSYTSNCSTGSPLRKVVSHIFGRNKLCTRQIPKGVWVHYCRKHYQRSRYRNPRGFALLQCDLVRKQIQRLHDWGGVTDWMIKVRKREEERLNKENAEALAANNAGHGRGGGKNKVTGGGSGNKDANIMSSSMAGAWGWLVQSTGSGKSTVDVLKILDRIEGDIASSGSSFPDVEILPVVVAAATTESRKSDESSSPDPRIAWEILSPGSGAAHPPPQRSIQNEVSHQATIEIQTPRKRRITTKLTVPTNAASHENTENLRPVSTTERRETKRARVSPTTPTKTTRAGMSDSEVNSGRYTIMSASTQRTETLTGQRHDENDEACTKNNTSMPTTTRRRSLRKSTRTSRPLSVG